MTMPNNFDDIASQLDQISGLDLDDLDTENNLDDQDSQDQGDGEAVEDEDNQEDQDLDAEGDEDKDSKVYEVKVNGEVLKLSEDELKAGFMRQSDYTKKLQSLRKEEVEPLQAQIEELSERARVGDDIDARFDQDPEALIGDMLLNITDGANQESVSNAYIEVTKYLIGHGALHPDIMNLFGVTEAGQRAAAQAVQNRKSMNQRAMALQSQQREVAPLVEQRETQSYIDAVETTLTDVATSFGIKAEDLDSFKKATLRVMHDEEMDDLKDIKKAARIALADRKAAEAEKKASTPATRRKTSPATKPTRQGGASSTKKGSIEDTIGSLLDSSAR